MKKKNLNALLLLSATNIIYTTGYFHLSTERPLAALIPESGDPALFIPDLESDQVKLWWVRRSMYFADFTVQAGRAYVQQNGSVTEDQILKAAADAVADKMSKELTDVVGVGISPPFGGLVPFGKRSAFPTPFPARTA